jgi:hypothetical protein
VIGPAIGNGQRRRGDDPGTCALQHLVVLLVTNDSALLSTNQPTPDDGGEL